MLQMLMRHLHHYTKGILFFFYFMGIALWAMAQTVTLKGVVKDANGMPLSGASVIVQGTRNGVVTDNNGNYSIAVTPGRHTIIVSFVGYASQRKEIEATEGGNAQDFVLSDASDLGAVTVIGSRNVSRTRTE